MQCASRQHAPPALTRRARLVAQADAAAGRPLVAGPWAAAWEGPHGRRAGAPAPQTWAMGIPLAGQASMPSLGGVQGLGTPRPSAHGGALPPWPPAAAAAAQRMPDPAQAPKPYPPSSLPGMAVAPLRRAASGASLLSATSSDASSGELGASSGEDELSLAGLSLGLHESLGRPRSVPASPSSVLTGPYRRAAAAAAALDAPKPSHGRAADGAPAAATPGGKPERAGAHSRSASASSSDSMSVVGCMAGRAGGAAGQVGSGLGLPPAQAAAAAAKGLGPLSALPLASTPKPPAAGQNPRQWLEGPSAGPAGGWAPLPYPAVFEPGAGKAGAAAGCLADSRSREPTFAMLQTAPLDGLVPVVPEVLVPMPMPAVQRRRPTLRRRLLRLLLAHRPRSGGHHHRREGRP